MVDAEGKRALQNCLLFNKRPLKIIEEIEKPNLEKRLEQI